MQLLLDTHPFIWFINGDNQLPEKVKMLIADSENECFLSIASIWESDRRSDCHKNESG